MQLNINAVIRPVHHTVPHSPTIKHQLMQLNITLSLDQYTTLSLIHLPLSTN